MPGLALVPGLLWAWVFLESQQHLVIAGDCPLNFSWANFTLAASACSNQDERGKCCRYINAFVAISIAKYAASTGKLGVPSAFSDICLTSVSETFKLYGIPASATVVCGLGPKIRVSYQCKGRGTVLEMMQSPNFTDVIGNCKVPLSLDSNCKRCLNYGIMYLHHLISADDNVAFSVCRDALFVTLANQGDNLLAVDMASCFFGVQGLNILPGPSPVFQRFSYRETTKATENFSTVIGKGGFGTVYKAQFSDGSLAAVKRMDKVSKQGEDEFCREMELLSRLHHRHLVALKGFCVERNESFLVYEYMENGSLKDHLHSPGRNPLSWKTRVQIAIDVANALEYLHFYCDPPLCHRDIKSSNILLDENFVAKVADFGLAHASRYGAISFEPVNTDIRGTPGYTDPEYVVTQELTDKSDIYSYGVLLLELVTGRRAIQDSKNLVEWSQKFMSNDSKLLELVDPVIGDSFDFEQLQLIVGIIQWCTQREGRARPSIKQVLRILSERFDPVHNGFGQLAEDEGSKDVGEGSSKVSMQGNKLIPYSGDARCLQSSSGTSRSCCSQSVLLESGSPQSPPGLDSR
ncbi:probable receptor-like protein kinase At1g49730 isoform X2 [Phoenix dactylifera]|uniref:Probable receptor-like protein kinase At1g49730 isoform X2 n=1 Tax=Phoenix dactylifera TaxID=42345 RepID=A0A8B8ZCP7_PHODC|nr:probable receptor-like protein kinase At1g49730 isoform X2 [Phoenix dactylifera]